MTGLIIPLREKDIQETIERALLGKIWLRAADENGLYWLPKDQAKYLIWASVAETSDRLGRLDAIEMHDGDELVGVKLTPFGETIQAFAELYRLTRSGNL